MFLQSGTKLSREHCDSIRKSENRIYVKALCGLEEKAPHLEKAVTVISWLCKDEKSFIVFVYL